MAGVRLDERLSWSGMVLLLLALYLFLYSPIAYIIYTSFASDTMWPFPWKPTIQAYEHLSVNRAYQQALWNSFLLSFGAATLSALFATMGGIALLKYRSRWRGLFGIIFISSKAMHNAFWKFFDVRCNYFNEFCNFDFFGKK